jgi:hypothetical protein
MNRNYKLDKETTQRLLDLAVEDNLVKLHKKVGTKGELLKKKSFLRIRGPGLFLLRDLGIWDGKNPKDPRLVINIYDHISEILIKIF